MIKKVTKEVWKDVKNSYVNIVDVKNFTIQNDVMNFEFDVQTFHQ